MIDRQISDQYKRKRFITTNDGFLPNHKCQISHEVSPEPTALATCVSAQHSRVRVQNVHRNENPSSNPLTKLSKGSAVRASS